MRSIMVLASDRFEDPENARVILLSAGGLVVVAVLVGIGTFWWWRSSKVEHPALGPLEVMGSRSWWKGDYTARRRRLEAARPLGAEPIDATAPPEGEPVDLHAAAAGHPPKFDDLADVSFAGDAAVAPAGVEAVEAVEVAEVAEVAEVPAAVPTEVAASSDLADLVVTAAPVADEAPEAPVVPDDVDAELDELVGAPAGSLRSDGDGDDPTSVSAEVPRPIDPLLRLQNE